jgi:four helix bundle protein
LAALTLSTVLVLVLAAVRVRVRVRECEQPTRSSCRYRGMLDHEKLDVYQCALRFAALAFRILENIPRGHAELSDQLRRATLSIPLNIAEGAGKPTEKDRSRFHAIARGSAMECGAIVDLLLLQALVEPHAAVEAKSLLVRLVAMLSKMCR